MDLVERHRGAARWVQRQLRKVDLQDPIRWRLAQVWRDVDKYFREHAKPAATR